MTHERDGESDKRLRVRNRTEMGEVLGGCTPHGEGRGGSASGERMRVDRD